MRRLLLLTALAVVSTAPAQITKETYEKIEAMIPMRDGAKLYTAIYVPKDRAAQHPILMERTPYSAGPYGPEAFRSARGSERFTQNRYIFVWQDVRGRYLSEGEFADVRPTLKPGHGPKEIDESTDTWDTIDWLVTHVPGNNGRVGMWGVSYPGFYAAAGAIDSHPSLKAVSPQAPVSDWFIGDDFHHHGAFFLQDAFSFMSGFGQPRPTPTRTPRRSPAWDIGGNAYKWFLEMGPLPSFNERILRGEVKFWNQMMEHGNYDAFWQDRSLPRHMTGVKCAVLTVGGWYDAEDLWGALHIYKHTEKQNPGIPNRLVMGPWDHGGWTHGNGRMFGGIPWDQNTSVFFRDEIEWPFFDAYLRGKGDVDLPDATMFDTGAKAWSKFDQWPPPQVQTKPVYFREARTLSLESPGETGRTDSYVSDPANPVPYQGGVLRGRSRDYMIDSQRFAMERDDVLTYTSPPLTESVTVAGHVVADLFVTMTGTDADFVVKLIDVHPSDAPDYGAKVMRNYPMLVRGDIFRGKFRRSYEFPEAFTPGAVERVKFELPDAFHTFKKGHRIMIQVQSSWFPLADRNPQTFTDIYRAKPSDFQKSTIQIHRSRRFASKVWLDVRK